MLMLIPEKYEHFRFCQKYFPSISSTGERKVSAVLNRCPDQNASVFGFFGAINFFAVSRFLNVAKIKFRCQPCQRSTLEIIRAFSFFG